MKTKIILISLLLLIFSCDKDVPDNIDFKQEMRNFVLGLSQYSKNINAEFIIIPQNGEQLATDNGEHSGVAATNYLNAIDGQGREDLFYGYDSDDKETPVNDQNYMIPFLDIEEDHGVEVLVTDYCFTHSKMDDSYSKNFAKSYISFAASDRELNIIPAYPAEPYNVNTNDIYTLADAKNFLYLINPENWSSKQDFINAVSQTDYDLILMDLFFNDLEFTISEISSLKLKKNGAKRLVISYMSIGEAEDYRYYWKSEWEKDKPEWLDKENPNWEGNYKVWYWEKGWQDIIFGNDASYLKKILDAGFDGVYLDIIDAFEYYE